MSNNGGAGTNGNQMRLARGLGWFSIGLGLAEVLAPRSIARLIGVRERHGGAIRLLGMRELVSGIALLTQRRPAGALWSRVGGDLINLGLLGRAATLKGTDVAKLSVATAAVAGVTVVDTYCSQAVSQHLGGRHSTVYVEERIEINRSPEELYAFWRNFESLPRFMTHLKSVQVTGEKQSHWVAKGPAGSDVEWDAEIITDRPNEVISWHSLEDSDVANAGSVWFKPAPGGRGTVVRVKLAYSPPAGMLGAKIAKLFGKNPDKLIGMDLQRFKHLMETGEAEGKSSSTARRFDDYIRA